jgi:hypothetical protein
MKHYFGLLLLALLGLASCSPNAGRWEDDPKNFSRAFNGNSQPPGLKILHSRYMRTPHFTYEFEYFFVAEFNMELMDGFIGSGQMKRFEPADASSIELEDHFQEKPDWFRPKLLEKYEVWIFKDEPRQHFRLFLDKETKEIHYTDFLM